MFWAAAMLQPRREQLALFSLGQAGFEIYAPRIKERRNGRPALTSLLFVNYCFVRIVDRWLNAHWAPGVVRIVCNGDRPAAVPDRVIDELRARQGRDGLVRLPPPPPALAFGDPVRIRGGPLVGLHGLFAGMAPHDRVLVLLDLLGRQRSISIPTADVVSSRK